MRHLIFMIGIPIRIRQRLYVRTTNMVKLEVKNIQSDYSSNQKCFQKSCWVMLKACICNLTGECYKIGAFHTNINEYETGCK